MNLRTLCHHFFEPVEHGAATGEQDVIYLIQLRGGEEKLQGPGYFENNFLVEGL